MSLPAYQELMRQIHVDIYVGLKNNVDPKECKKALQELAAEISKSVDWASWEPKRKS